MNKFENILLIDDDEPTNFLHNLIIEESGLCANIHTKFSAKEALNWLRSEDNPIPDVIFLDINMPEMNGWEFLEEYKKLPNNQKSKMVIVMLTTSLNPNDRDRAHIMQEISQFHNKPLSVGYLQELVETLRP